MDEPRFGTVLKKQLKNTRLDSKTLVQAGLNWSCGRRGKKPKIGDEKGKSKRPWVPKKEGRFKLGRGKSIPILGVNQKGPPQSQTLHVLRIGKQNKKKGWGGQVKRGEKKKWVITKSCPKTKKKNSLHRHNIRRGGDSVENK